MCYRDITFCGSKTENHTCGRKFTKEVQEGADKWWGKPGAPISLNKFCEEDKLINDNF